MADSAAGTLIRLKPYRCSLCGWQLFKGYLKPGCSIQLKCHGCKAIVTVQAVEGE